LYPDIFQSSIKNQMDLKMNRRKAIQFMAATAMVTAISANPLAAGQDGKKDVKLDGGWQYKDMEYEKHIPQVSVARDGESAEITVQVKHPQGEFHHISTFKIYSEDRIEITRCDLHPTQSVPKATFNLKVKPGTALIATTDCNIHGIWMKPFKA
jgi:desulfoferrodoxin-like iron-binding protein